MAVIDYPGITISTAASWPDDSSGWTARPTLRLVNAVKCVNPEMPHATFRQIFGETNESDRTAFATEAALDLTDHYIKVEIGSALWVGIIIGHTDERYAGDGATPTGERAFDAFGLEQILVNQPLPGSLVYQNETSYEIARILPFNRTHARGGNVFAGNRSAEKVGGLWRFVEVGEPWSVKNILEYLFDYFVTGPWGALGGQIDDLDQIVIEFDPTGMTTYQILNELVSRKRGYCWSVRYGTQAEAPELYPYIYIHGISGATIASGDFLFNPNPEVGAVALSDNLLQSWNPEESARDLMDSVEVRGAPIRMVCSVLQGGWDWASLVNGWTEAEAEEVRKGASEEDGYDELSMAEKAQVNDDFRSNERLNHVFARYVLDEDAWTNLLANVGVTMELDESFNATGEPVPGSTAWFHWGRPFQRTLPLKETVDYSAEGWQSQVNDDLESRTPFAYILAGRYDAHYVHDLKIPYQSNGRVIMEDRGGALRVQFSPSYRMATDAEWEGAEPGLNSPGLAIYNSNRVFVVTVSFDLDEPLRVTKSISGNIHPDFRRRIIISVPTAQLIVAHWHTFVGIAPSTIDPSLSSPLYIHLDAGMDGIIMDGETKFGVKLRDDADQLRAIALLAADYYGSTRQAMKLTCLGLADYAKPGKYITNVTADGQTIETNGIVTRQTWREDGTTLLETSWFDVNWTEVGASMVRSKNASVESRLAQFRGIVEEGE